MVPVPRPTRRGTIFRLPHTNPCRVLQPSVRPDIDRAAANLLLTTSSPARGRRRWIGASQGPGGPEAGALVEHSRRLYNHGPPPPRICLVGVRSRIRSSSAMMNRDRSKAVRHGPEEHRRWDKQRLSDQHNGAIRTKMSGRATNNVGKTVRIRQRMRVPMQSKQTAFLSQKAQWRCLYLLFVGPSNHFRHGAPPSLRLASTPAP